MQGDSPGSLGLGLPCFHGIADTPPAPHTAVEACGSVTVLITWCGSDLRSMCCKGKHRNMNSLGHWSDAARPVLQTCGCSLLPVLEPCTL